jgi:hypothetical protein
LGSIVGVGKLRFWVFRSIVPVPYSDDAAQKFKFAVHRSMVGVLSFKFAVWRTKFQAWRLEGEEWRAIGDTGVLPQHSVLAMRRVVPDC